MNWDELRSTIKHQLEVINNTDDCCMYYEVRYYPKEGDTDPNALTAMMKYTYYIAERIKATGTIYFKDGREMLPFVTSILTEALTESGIVEKAGEEAYGKRMH
jgi:hypothetical protein